MTAHTPDSILAFVRAMAPDDTAAQLRILAHAYCDAMRDASVGFQRRALVRRYGTRYASEATGVRSGEVDPL